MHKLIPNLIMLQKLLLFEYTRLKYLLSIHWVEKKYRFKFAKMTGKLQQKSDKNV